MQTEPAETENDTMAFEIPEDVSELSLKNRTHTESELGEAVAQAGKHHHHNRNYLGSQTPKHMGSFKSARDLHHYAKQPGNSKQTGNYLKNSNRNLGFGTRRPSKSSKALDTSTTSSTLG